MCVGGGGWRLGSRKRFSSCDNTFVVSAIAVCMNWSEKFVIRQCPRSTIIILQKRVVRIDNTGNKVSILLIIPLWTRNYLDTHLTRFWLVVIITTIIIIARHVCLPDERKIAHVCEKSQEKSPEVNERGKDALVRVKCFVLSH